MPIDFEYIRKTLDSGVYYIKMSTNFDELDPLNMLHNSRYQYILERATYSFFNAVKLIEDFDTLKYPDLHHVVHAVNLNYIKPLFGVTPFYVAISPQKLREAGAVYNVAFLSEDRINVYCKGTRSIARVRPKTFEPVGWSAKFRETHEFIINILKNEK